MLAEGVLDRRASFGEKEKIPKGRAFFPLEMLLKDLMDPLELEGILPIIPIPASNDQGFETSLR
jgi:hypothetical protein